MRGPALIVALGAVAACGPSYTGSARDFAPARLRREEGWIATSGPALVRQRGDQECGLAAAAMLLAYWQRPVDLDRLRATVPLDRDRGLAAGRLRQLVRDRGLQAFLIQGRLDDLEHELARGRPVLVGLVKPHGRVGFAHYELVVAIHRSRRLVVTLDPATGWRQNSYQGFLAEWNLARRLSLVAWSEHAAAGHPASVRKPRKHEPVRAGLPVTRASALRSRDEAPTDSFRGYPESRMRSLMSARARRRSALRP